MIVAEAAGLESIQFHRRQWPKASVIALLALMGLREAISVGLIASNRRDSSRLQLGLTSNKHIEKSVFQIILDMS